MYLFSGSLQEKVLYPNNGINQEREWHEDWHRKGINKMTKKKKKSQWQHHRCTSKPRKYSPDWRGEVDGSRWVVKERSRGTGILEKEC